MSLDLRWYQKKARVRNFLPAILGPGDGCTNFMGAWDLFVLSAGKPHAHYAAPIGAFFWPEICAFMGFWGEISSTVSKLLSDRKVSIHSRSWPLIAVNGRQ